MKDWKKKTGMRTCNLGVNHGLVVVVASLLQIFLIQKPLVFLLAFACGVMVF
jgi:hypothetical protein